MTDWKETEYKKEEIWHKKNLKGFLSQQLHMDLQHQKDREFQEGYN